MARLATSQGLLHLSPNRSATTPLPYTLHPKPYTLHPSPYTLHPTPCTPHPTPYTLHPTPYTPHFTPYALQPTPYSACSHPPFRCRPRRENLNGFADFLAEHGSRAKIWPGLAYVCLVCSTPVHPTSSTPPPVLKPLNSTPCTLTLKP